MWSRPALQLVSGETHHVPTFLEMLISRQHGSAFQTALTHLLLKEGNRAIFLCTHSNLHLCWLFWTQHQASGTKLARSRASRSSEPRATRCFAAVHRAKYSSCSSRVCGCTVCWPQLHCCCACHAHTSSGLVRSVLTKTLWWKSCPEASSKSFFSESVHFRVKLFQVPWVLRSCVILHFSSCCSANSSRCDG